MAAVAAQLAQATVQRFDACLARVAIASLASSARWCRLQPATDQGAQRERQLVGLAVRHPDARQHAGGQPFVTDQQARIFRREAGRPWHALAGGLPDPLPAMPYALRFADGRLFAGLANGELWRSGDAGDTWTACALRGDPLPHLLALDAA